MSLANIKKGSSAPMTQKQVKAMWERQLNRANLPDAPVDARKSDHQGPPKATAGTGGFGVTKKGKKKR